MAVTCSAPAGQKYPNYNVREFVKRRAKQDFRQHAAETDAARIDQLWSKAQEDFAVTQRQRIVYSMYAPKQKSVMVSSPSDGQLRWLAQVQAAAFAIPLNTLACHERLLAVLGQAIGSAAWLLHLTVEGPCQLYLTAATATLGPHVLLQLITVQCLSAGHSHGQGLAKADRGPRGASQSERQLSLGCCTSQSSNSSKELMTAIWQASRSPASIAGTNIS